MFFNWRTLSRAKAWVHGPEFWARGYVVLTVGRDEATIREDIQNQAVRV